MFRGLMLAIPSLALAPASAASTMSTTSCVGEYGAFSSSSISGHAGDPYIRAASGRIELQDQPELCGARSEMDR
jgi:hypothetical protein